MMDSTALQDYHERYQFCTVNPDGGRTCVRTDGEIEVVNRGDRDEDLDEEDEDLDDEHDEGCDCESCACNDVDVDEDDDEEDAYLDVLDALLESSPEVLEAVRDSFRAAFERGWRVGLLEAEKRLDRLIAAHARHQ